MSEGRPVRSQVGRIAAHTSSQAAVSYRQQPARPVLWQPDFHIHLTSRRCLHSEVQPAHTDGYRFSDDVNIWGKTCLVDALSSSVDGNVGREIGCNVNGEEEVELKLVC